MTLSRAEVKHLFIKLRAAPMAYEDWEHVRDLATTALGLMDERDVLLAAATVEGDVRVLARQIPTGYGVAEVIRERTRADTAEARVRELEGALRDVLDAIDAQPYHIDYRPRDRARALLTERSDGRGEAARELRPTGLENYAATPSLNRGEVDG